MEPVTPDELREHLPLINEATLVVYAEHQPPYQPLPAVKFPDGLVFTEWSPTEGELAWIAKGGPLKIRLWQWTFNQPLQPVRVEMV